MITPRPGRVRRAAGPVPASRGGASGPTRRGGAPE